MMGENLTGKQAAEQGLVTEAVPADQLLEARVREIAQRADQAKDGNALRATKWAIRRMTEMTYDNAEDYLIRAQEALHSFRRR
jgi:trans-feruloyl-CoA hydratase/vanillin synthase